MHWGGETRADRHYERTVQVQVMAGNRKPASAAIDIRWGTDVAWAKLAVGWDTHCQCATQGEEPLGPLEGYLTV